MIGHRKSALKVVYDLLDTQKAALLSGNLSELSKMEDRLSRAFERLKTTPIGVSDMAQVKDRAARNATLLQAAQVGVETARGQLSNRSTDGFTTYDAHGHSHVSSAKQSRTLARR